MEEERKLLNSARIKSYADQLEDAGKIITRKIKDTRLITVTYCVAIVLIGALLFGYAIGYSSPVINELEKERDNETEGYLERNEYQGVFSALMPIGALVGAPLAGWLVDYTGRKKSLLLCSFPFTVGWVITILSHAVVHGSDQDSLIRVMLFAGRFFVGIGVGAASLCVPLYVVEVSPSNLRGLYGSANQLGITIGIFVVEISGTYIKYYWLAVIPLALTFMFAVLCTTIKETPRWLISQGKATQAGSTLLWLRGNSYDIVDEQREIEDQIQSEGTMSVHEIIKEFKTRSVYHPLVLVLFLMFFQQFCGINAIIFNAEDIFDDVATEDPALVSSLSVGLTQVIATFVGVILTDPLGRRTLLISGAIIMCVSISVAGVYELLHHNGHHRISAMGISGLIVYNIGFSIGWGPLPWLMTSELIPMRVRGAGVGIATFVNWLLAAIVTGGYKFYQNAVNPWFAFWSFGIVCFFAAVFVAIFIPETKRKSLEEIERNFEVAT